MKGLSNSYVEGIVKKAISGRITTKEAAARLGCSRQYVNKLKRKYDERGRSAFNHGNEGKNRAWKTRRDVEGRIIELYVGEYHGFNFSHFCEKLNEDKGIAITRPAMARVLKEAGFKSPKIQIPISF